MGFKWRFFWYFSFAIERKVRRFRVKGLSPSLANASAAPSSEGAKGANAPRADGIRPYDKTEGVLQAPRRSTHQ